MTQPAQAMARFFSESFERRTGTPLQIVTGDPRTAALVALGAPSRPSLYLGATPERSPWVTPEAVKAKGAIVVWPTADTAGTPPPEIKERFPELVPEVPRAFERSVQGRLPLHPHRLGTDPSARAAVAAAAVRERAEAISLCRFWLIGRDGFSFRLDAGLLRHLGPLRDLALDVAGEVSGVPP